MQFCIENRVAIPVETKAREFYAKLFCSLVLAEEGYHVFLGEQQQMLQSIEDLAPCIYIDKSYASTKRKGFERCIKAGAHVAAWDEEGLVYFDEEAYALFRIDPACMPLMSCIFSWGEAQAEILKRYSPESLPVFETGNPRFDLLRPELRSFYDTRVSRLKKEFGRIILVNTAFPFANHGRREFSAQQLYEKYPLAAERGAFFEQWQRVQADGMKSFLEILPMLSRSFPEHTLIVRPHPSENSARWIAATESLDNAKVNTDGNVIEWILASECVVHFDCTSGIEAFLLDVPAAVYRTDESPGFEQLLPNRLSCRAETAEQLIDFVKRSISGDAPDLREDPERMQLLCRYAAGCQGAFASEAIAQALRSLGLPRREAESSRQADPLRRIWRGFLKYYRRAGNRRSSYARQKFEHLSLEEVSEAAAGFAKVLNRFHNIRIKEVGHLVFELKSSNSV